VSEFRPYIKTLNLGGIDVRFLIATEEAQRWYDPVKEHALLEFAWVLEHIDLCGQRIIDAGAHHGLYTCFLGLASQGTSELISLDAMVSNCALVEANAALNGVKTTIRNVAVSDKRGTVSFKDASNGHITKPGEEGTISVESIFLTDVMPAPTIVKLDVEGAEFYILKQQLAQLTSVKHWIIEVHPSANRHPPELMALLRNHGLKLKWLNRAKSVVEDYPDTADWTLHTTVFATADERR
jgi:FkbM family methyltransferase